MTERAPGVPLLLVGTKSDLRDSTESGGPIVEKSVGEALAAKLHATYVEVSAKTLNNITKPFTEAVRLATENEQKARDEKKGCCVML